MNWKTAGVGALVVVPLLVVLALGFGQDPHAVPFVLSGKPAPPFALPDLAGKTLSLAQFRGKPVVLNFWSTWCGPCQLEHDLLQAAARHYGERVQFLGIVYQDGAEPVRQFLVRHPSPYPHVMDESSRTAIDFGVSGVPETYIVAPNGTIVHKQAGVLTEAVLRQHLDPLVQS